MLAAALFVAAFYVYDGVSVVSGLVDRISDSTPESPSPSAAVASDELSLPDGMPEEFALVMWAEQSQSQRAINPLTEGEVASVKIGDVAVNGDRAVVKGTLVFTNGTRAPGAIGLHRFEDTWYLSYISASAATTERQESRGSIPRVSEVDSVLLNTVIAEQNESRTVAQDIVDGRIDEIRAGSVKKGPNTATVPLVLVGESGEREAELIAIKTEFRGDDFWFLAKFDESDSGKQ